MSKSLAAATHPPKYKPTFYRPRVPPKNQARPTPQWPRLHQRRKTSKSNEPLWKHHLITRSGSTGPVVAGVVVGILALLALIGGLWFFLYYRPKRRSRQNQQKEDIDSAEFKAAHDPNDPSHNIHPFQLNSGANYTPYNPSEGRYCASLHERPNLTFWHLR